jgi:hypothetical protein
MKIILAIAASICLSIVSESANANYTGLQVERQRVTLQDGTLMNQFRVYAMCSDPDDYITAVSGSPTLGNIVIQSRNLNDSGAGSNFYNPPSGGVFAPSIAAITANPDVEHDTFVTIGISISEQAPLYDLTRGHILSFTGIGSVTEINSNNFGWFTPGRAEQGRAGFSGDADFALRVLIMQLTVSSTSNVRGTVALSGINHLPNPSAFTIAGQTFNSIPTPSGFVVAILGLTSRRRRRK